MKHPNVENYTYCNLLRRYLTERQDLSNMQKRLIKIIIDEVIESPERDDFVIKIPMGSVHKGDCNPNSETHLIKETLKDMQETLLIAESERDLVTKEYVSINMIGFFECKEFDEMVSLKIPLSGFRDLYIFKLKAGVKIKIEK